MTRTIFRRGGIILGGVVGLLLVSVLAAAVADRPQSEPLALDRGAPETAAYLAAETVLLDHHGLEHTEHLVQVPDPSVRVRVLEVGSGQPVLMLPPAPGEAARFAPLLAELDGYRFLLVNLPGGGGSDGIDLRAVDQRRLAGDTLDAVYEHFDIDAVPVVAASVGGTWALWYGLDRPERVSAGVQLGIPPALEGTSVPPMLVPLGVPGLNRIFTATLLPSGAPERAADGFAVMGHPSETLASLPRAALEFEYALEQLPHFGLTWRGFAQSAFRFGGLAGWDPAIEIGRDELAGLDHPTLFVWPAEDPFGDVDAGRELAAHLPEADLRVVGVGHLPWLDDPAGVADLVQAFLDPHDPAHDSTHRPRSAAPPRPVGHNRASWRP